MKQVSGFRHLSGLTCWVEIDGSVADGATDIAYSWAGFVNVGAGGTIDVPDTFHGSVVAGKTFPFWIRTLPLSFEAQAAGRGSVKNVSKLHIRASGSGDLYCAPAENIVAAVRMTISNPAGFSPLVPMQEVPLMGDWDQDAAVIIGHDSPARCAIHAMAIEVVMGG